MNLVQGALRSVTAGMSTRFHRHQAGRTLSTSSTSGTGINSNQNPNAHESADEFERRIFGDMPSSNTFYQKLDWLQNSRDKSRFSSNLNSGNRSEFLDSLDDTFTTLSDGMDGKLKEAATYFKYDPEEVGKEDYKFRPDKKFLPGNTYDVKDLDLTKPAERKPFKRTEFQVTSEEVMRKADFRNVRFLANFITEAGIIIKRSKTKISAKAQRKVAREIKTARAFGLMPFTTMGTKQFVFGKTMEDLDEDYEYETYSHNFVDSEAS